MQRDLSLTANRARLSKQLNEAQFRQKASGLFNEGLLGVRYRWQRLTPNYSPNICRTFWMASGFIGVPIK
jgi:hypothetical protein